MFMTLKNFASLATNCSTTHRYIDTRRTHRYVDTYRNRVLDSGLMIFDLWLKFHALLVLRFALKRKKGISYSSRIPIPFPASTITHFPVSFSTCRRAANCWLSIWNACGKSRCLRYSHTLKHTHFLYQLWLSFGLCVGFWIELGSPFVCHGRCSCLMKRFTGQ